MRSALAAVLMAPLTLGCASAPAPIVAPPTLAAPIVAPPTIGAPAAPPASAAPPAVAAPPAPLAPPSPVAAPAPPIVAPPTIGDAPPGVADPARPAIATDPAPPEAPASAHPDPRVIIDVAAVKGPLAQAVVQAKARSTLWGHVIACYRPGAYRDAKLRGVAKVRVVASKAGSVKSARVASTTFPDAAVATCLAGAARKLKLPGARASSSFTMTIQVAPGDAPLRPPSDPAASR